MPRVSIDTRTIQDGDIFIPVGEGINYADDAIKKGATVMDVDLVDYAKARRQKFKGTVIGITGSFGKTTLKDTLVAMLSSEGVSATEKNFNNEIGVPLTIANASLDDAYWVIEMAIRKPGDMAILRDIVQPDMAVLSGFGHTHMEFYDTPLDLLREKLTIISDKTKALFFPSNMLFKSDLVAQLSNQSIQLVETNVDAIINTNIRQCQAIATHFGLNEDQCEAAILNVKSSPHRLKRTMLNNGTVLVDDSYNSNPMAVQFAVGKVTDWYPGAKCLVVLGDMGELGKDSQQLHQESLDWVKGALPTIQVITYGKKFTTSAHNVDTIDSLYNYVQSKLTEIDVLLVKGSRSNHLDLLCEMLLENSSK